MSLLKELLKKFVMPSKKHMLRRTRQNCFRKKKSLRPLKEDGGEKIRGSTPFLSLMAADNGAGRAGILKGSPRPLTDAFHRPSGKKRFQPVCAFSLVPSLTVTSSDPCISQFQ
jgi:hypothetical protein